MIAKEIVSLMPPHSVYVEPFCGGAAVLYAKPHNPRIKEVLCDTFDALIIFYEVLRDEDKCKQLIEQLELTPFAETEYKNARTVVKEPEKHSDIEVARCVVVACMQSFGNGIDKGFARKKNDNGCIMSFQAKQLLIHQAGKRILNAEIWKMDALKSIEYFDSEETLFYCDPPYLDTNCGHYSHYTVEDYEALLDALSNIKGKFMLSGYPNLWADAKGFHVYDIPTIKGMNKVSGQGAQIKIERVWMNFEHAYKQHTLF